MEENTKKTTKENNFSLVLTLAILIIMIIGLGAGIFVLRLGKKPQVTVPETMEGWDGPISDSTKASMFSEEIDEKLASDSNYNYNNAEKDYSYALNGSEGELKVYLAINYAEFVFDQNSDLNRAVEILDSVGNLVGDDVVLKNAYNGTYYDIYLRSGENEMADYYMDLINEDNGGEGVEIPFNEAIRMMGGEIENE